PALLRTRFPYTTLFRSRAPYGGDSRHDDDDREQGGGKPREDASHEIVWPRARSVGRILRARPRTTLQFGDPTYDVARSRNPSWSDRKSTRLNSSHVAIS